MVLELKVEGESEFLKTMKEKAPTLLRKMAFNSIGNVAGEGRKIEQKTAHRLEMGQIQTKRNGTRIRSKWDSKLGYVSTTRTSSSTGAYRMASFAWERVKKKSQVSSEYSNQLANLWSHRTRPYRERSPMVGQPGHLMRWEKGAQRPQMYFWSKVYNVMSAQIPSAIARTDAEFQKKWEAL